MSTKQNYSIFISIFMMLISIQVLTKDKTLLLPITTLEVLPNTDGYGLLSKPPLPSRQENKKILSKASYLVNLIVSRL